MMITYAHFYMLNGVPCGANL